MTCPACGAENGASAKFCSECGHALAVAPAPTREERKVVTCLFCDLVGFTARAERMDPEDVRRLLQPYHARVRSELERHGGTRTSTFTARALMWLASGEGERAASDAARGLEVGQSARDAQVLLLALGAAARVEAEVGTRNRADELISEHLSELQSLTPSYAFRELVWVALRLQRAREVREALEAHGAPGSWLDACRAALDGSFEEAADLYERIGSFPNEAGRASVPERGCSGKDASSEPRHSSRARSSSTAASARPPTHARQRSCSPAPA